MVFELVWVDKYSGTNQQESLIEMGNTRFHLSIKRNIFKNLERTLI